MRSRRESLANWSIGGVLLALGLGAATAACAQQMPGPGEPAPVGEPAPCYGAPSQAAPLPPGPPTLTKEKNDLPDDVPNAFDETHYANEGSCWHAGVDVGLYIFRPVRITNDPAFTVTTTAPVQHFVINQGLTAANSAFTLPVGLGAGPANTTQYEFEFGRSVVPVLSASVVAPNGFGVRVRWFGFDQNARSVRPTTGGARIPLGTFTNSDISAGILPFEGTGNTVFQSAGPPGFGITSPDTSKPLGSLLQRGVPLPAGIGGPGDSDPNAGPATGLAQSLLANGIPSDFLTFSQSLRLEAYDLEATQEFALAPVGFQVSLGARYAYVSQTYGASRFHPAGSFALPTVEVGPPDDFIGVTVLQDDAVLSAAESFSGVGPTMSLGIQYQLPYLAGLTVFGNVRGSIIFGQQKQTAFQQTRFNGAASLFGSTDNEVPVLEFLPTPFNQFTFMENEVKRDRAVAQWEYEAGVGWGQNFGRTGFFLQVAVTGQEWHGVGNPINLKSDLRLFGGKVNTGFDF
jgi:hypothetical protein